MLHRYAAFIFLFPAIILAGVITKDISFSSTEFTFSKIEGYDLIVKPGEATTWEKGKPLLPAITYHFLLPPTAEITNIEIVSKEIEDLPGEYLPYPVQTIRPLSAEKSYPFVGPDPSVYNSTLPYPAEIVKTVPTGCLSGYRIGSIILFPIQYLPAERRLRLYKNLIINIYFEEGRYEPVSLTQSQVELFGAEARDLVANPEMVDKWAPAVKESKAGEVDYVIITSRSLVSAWDALKNWKIKKGVNCEVVGTDSIYARYPGRDNQEKIRNFIRDYWQNKGLKWVLLGGDDIIIPDRKTRLYIEESTIVGSIPTDMYYADLQWSWDGNRNNYFGEIGDTVDLFHDLYIGRAPIDNATNLATFIRKDTIFDKRPDTTYVQTLLLPSQMLFSPYHGEVINNIIASYFPTSGWKIAKLKDPASTATRDSLSRGYQFCHIAAHGSPTSLSVLSISQISQLTNGIKYDIMNAINCDCGSFDGKDCIAESLVNYPNGGCIATMLNSRYGLGYPPALGPSEMIDLEVYKSFWLRQKFQIGSAHGTAKDVLRSLAMSQAATRWCVYEQTLFGDPELPMWSTTPRRITVTHSSSIPANPQTFRVMVSYSGNPIKNALVCAMKGSEVYAVGRTNSSGWVDLFVYPTTTGTMSVTVTARDYLPYEGTCSVTSGSPRPCIVYQSHRLDDSGGNNNGRLDPGETVNLYFTLKNNGNAGATNVQGRLRTTSTYITFIDSTATYGNMNAGDTARGDNYRIQVSGSTPQGTEVEFIVYATANEGNWQPFQKLIVGVPPTPRSIWADHDTCICAFTVTSYGAFGTTYPYGEGSGFKYSKLASYGNLYYASMLAGTDANYIADRFYGRPSSTINQDFRIVDTLRPIIPPRRAEEEYEAIYNDAGHPTPKGLEIVQWSLSLSSPGYDDWVIVCFDYYNRGSNPINNFYSGMMFDFDIYNNVTSNIVRSDSVRRFIYMRRSSTMQPVCGVRLLQPKVARNLSAIDHALYVIPSSQMTEAVKDSFLSGRIRMPVSNRAYNWSVCVSAGPFNLPVNGKVRVAYAIVGGNDTTLAIVNSDSAQSWWDKNVEVAGEELEKIVQPFYFRLCPNPVKKRTSISYSLPAKENISIRVFDASGRMVEKIFEGEITGKGNIEWKPQNLSAGVYFIQIDRPNCSRIDKVIYLR